MEYIKLYEEYWSKPWYAKTRETRSIKDKLQVYDIRLYSVNDDNTINIDQDVYFVDLSNCGYLVDTINGDYIPARKLLSLKSSPRVITGNFDISNNDIRSFEGGPERVGKNLDCSKNKISSLVGSPRIINGRFDCSRNNIMTFEGAPEYVNSFNPRFNPIESVWNLFQDWSKVELLNEYDALRVTENTPQFVDWDSMSNGQKSAKPIVILERLNEFLMDIGKEPIEKLNGYKNI